MVAEQILLEKGELFKKTDAKIVTFAKFVKTHEHVKSLPGSLRGLLEEVYRKWAWEEGSWGFSNLR